MLDFFVLVSDSSQCQRLRSDTTQISWCLHTCWHFSLDTSVSSYACLRSWTRNLTYVDLAVESHTRGWSICFTASTAKQWDPAIFSCTYTCPPLQNPPWTLSSTASLLSNTPSKMNTILAFLSLGSLFVFEAKMYRIVYLVFVFYGTVLYRPVIFKSVTSAHTLYWNVLRWNMWNMWYLGTMLTTMFNAEADAFRCYTTEKEASWGFKYPFMTSNSEGEIYSAQLG